MSAKLSVLFFLPSAAFTQTTWTRAYLQHVLKIVEDGLLAITTDRTDVSEIDKRSNEENSVGRKEVYVLTLFETIPNLKDFLCP